MSKHNLEFKLSVIKHYQSGADGFKKTAKHFVVSVDTVREWEKQYHERGIPALIEKRGRKKQMQKPPTLPPDKPLDEMSKEELLAELQHLRMENAYLKKLRALIQEKKASKQKHNSSMN